MRFQSSMLAPLFIIGACATDTESISSASETCEDFTVGEPITIFPPNHQMVQFTLDDCVTINECAPEEPVCGNMIVEAGEQCDDGNLNEFDGCDLCRLVDITPDKRGSDAPALTAPAASAVTTTLRITSITSNEPGDGGGDGTTSADFRIIDDVTFELRAERSGGRDGRVYRVNFEDQDGDTGTCMFVVPHGRGHGRGCK